jgi:hypothetical protein
LPQLTFYSFIASQIYLNGLNALTKKTLTQGGDEALIYIGNFQKKFLYSCTIFVAKSSYVVVFAFAYVLENFAMLYGDFCMISYSGKGNEAMKC